MLDLAKREQPQPVPAAELALLPLHSAELVEADFAEGELTWHPPQVPLEAPQAAEHPFRNWLEAGMHSRGAGPYRPVALDKQAHTPPGAPHIPRPTPQFQLLKVSPIHFFS
jgi:hypothetical protein